MSIEQEPQVQQKKATGNAASSQKALDLLVQTRSGKKVCNLTLPADATVDDLSSLFYTEMFPKYHPSRQWFTYSSAQNTKPVHLESGKSLSFYGISPAERATIVFKDLGPQISWKVVFLVEYFGPLFIHPLVYFLRFGTGAGEVSASAVQLMILGMMVFHFAKREYETLFIHRFSHGTMPIMNIFKNSFHYWILSGLWFALEAYTPSFAKATAGPLTGFHYAALVVFVWAELSNLSTHVTLRNLRPAGTKVRKIPYGYGFDAPFNLSSPNYFFETIAWLAVFAVARTPGCFVFLLAAVYQMYVWALKKHRNYKKEFGTEYPKGRKAMFPFMA